MSLKKRDSITITRSSEGSYNNATGEYSDTKSIIPNVRCNVQPYKEQAKKDVNLEGLNLSGAIKIHTETEIKAESDNLSSLRKADVIIWKNKNYKAKIVNEWSNHYECIAILDQND